MTRSMHFVNWLLGRKAPKIEAARQWRKHSDAEVLRCNIKSSDIMDAIITEALMLNQNGADAGEVVRATLAAAMVVADEMGMSDTEFTRAAREIAVLGVEV